MASENPPGWPTSTAGRLVIGHDAGFDFSDRLRLWEVRRVCQVKPSLATYMRSSSRIAVQQTSPRSDDGDYSLTAILRCVINRMDADIAFVSLLDAERQYFVSGATRADDEWAATASMESTRWFGCDSIVHAGQLCHRTMQIGSGGVYEEMDLSQQNYTKSLPIVNGDVARFKRYIGVPMVTDQGYTIGALFMFSDAAAESGLTHKERVYLQDTTKQVVRQLEQAVQALEWRRMTKFNTAVGSMVHTTDLTEAAEHGSMERPPVQRLDSGETDILIRRMYERAVEVVLDSYELDAAYVQEMPLHIQRPSAELASETNSPPSFFARSQADPDGALPSLSHATALMVCKTWPEGRVLYRTTDTEGDIMSSDWTDLRSNGVHLGRELARAMPDAQQLLLMPLWDPLHERVVALMVGIASGWSRCYTRINDLVPLHVFCRSIVARARQFESQHMDQRKTDFMGSVSHEMRSPLHGMLANVELLLQTTQCNPEQTDMLQSAAASGKQLLDSIDKVLQYCHISSKAEKLEELGSDEAVQGLRKSSVSSDQHDLGALVEHILSQTVASHVQWAAASTPSEHGDPNSKMLGDSSGRDSYAGANHLCARQRPSAGRSRSSHEHPYQVPVVLDIAETVLVRQQDASSVQTIVENLMSNALKNTDQGCIRISINVESNVGNAGDSIVLRVRDTGKGIPTDFLRHKLYTPFAQNDSLGVGVGIGLSLVKLEVESLGGTINIESRRAVGTTVAVRIPVAATTTVQPLEAVQLDLQGPAGTVQLYVPARASTDVQLANGLDMLQSSLESTISARTKMSMRNWESTELPDLMLVLQEDLSEFLREPPSKRTLPIVLLCSPIHHPGVTTPPKDVSLVCPFLPLPVITTIGERVAKASTADRPSRPAFMRYDSHALARSTKQFSEGLQDLQLQDTEGGMQDTECTPRAHTSEHGLGDEIQAVSSDGSRSPSNCVRDPLMPSLLLVDDNLINLKVLGMYTTKCGIPSPVSTSGGQEAIDEYLAALTAGHKKPFDMIFMDLSMPEVSGFDATAAIRRCEAQARVAVPAYIVALTGLVSPKDRKAAFEAGVDAYLTKPAKLRDIQDVLETWRRLKYGET